MITVMGFRSGRIYVAIDDLAVDLKVYLTDLNSQYQTDYELGDVSAISKDSDKPLFALGDAVEISARAFDTKRRRFELNLFPASH